MAMYKDEVRKAAIMLQQGKSFEEVGDALNKSHNTVRKHVSLKNSGRIVAMFSLLDKGFTLEEVGERFGISKQRVAQLVGNDRPIGSSGRKSQIDISEKTLAGMMDVAKSLGLPVRVYKNGYDLRALVAVMDLIADGKAVIKLVK